MGRDGERGEPAGGGEPGQGPLGHPQLEQELWCHRHQPRSSWGPQPREGWGKPLSLETFCSRPIGVPEINLS